MTSIRCNMTDCKYNGGLFCQKSILFIYGAICGELVDKYGNRKDPKQWVNYSNNPNINNSDYGVE